LFPYAPVVVGHLWHHVAEKKTLAHHLFILCVVARWSKMAPVVGMASIIFQCGRVLCGYGGVRPEVIPALGSARGAFQGHMLHHVLRCLGVVSVVYGIVYLADVLRVLLDLADGRS